MAHAGMIAVPNYQDNLYHRLWCVYAAWREKIAPSTMAFSTKEIFIASRLKVYVGLAHTLAPAGKCRAKTARCSDAEDEVRRLYSTLAIEA